MSTPTILVPGVNETPPSEASGTALAVNRLADVAEKGGREVTNGLGNLAKYANATVLAVFLCIFAVNDRRNAAERSELTTLLRESNEKNITAQQNIAAENRAAQDRRFDRTESTHSKHMEKMGATIERAITSMESATRVLEKVADKNSGGGGGP